jgi:dihydrofolate reductase
MGVGSLIYSVSTSLDGYLADETGNFDFAAPDAEVHAFVNDTLRSATTHLYGRRLYEVMAGWETLDDPHPQMADFARIWRGVDKVVYSRTLEAPPTTRTRIERSFDPDAVRRLKEASAGDLVVGGADLGGQAIAAGLVDEVRQFLVPVLVGGGTRALPDGVRTPLELTEVHRFAGGTVYLRHRVRHGHPLPGGGPV